MSVNKKIMVVGCSFSTGEECCDYEIVENYYDYKEDPSFHPPSKQGKEHEEFTKKKYVRHQDMHDEFRDKLVPAWAERPDVKQMIKEKNESDGGALLFPHNPQRFDPLPYWQWYNDKHCYSQLLHDQTDYNVINAGRRGTGINYQHLIYNIHRQIKANNKDGYYWDAPGNWPAVYTPEKQFARSWYLEAYYPAVYKAEQHIHGNTHENFKWNFNEVSFCGEERDPNFRYDECMDSADVLIWQFTGEPRYAVTLRDRDEIAIGSSIQQLDRWFSHYYKFLPGGEFHRPMPTPSGVSSSGNRLEDIPGKKEIRDWYKYYHDPAQDMAKSVGWMENIIKLREAKGLKTIMLCITSQFTKRYGINPRNNEHTASIGFDYDSKLPNEEVVDMLRENPQIRFNRNTESGLVYQGVKKIKLDSDTKAKWGHLNKVGHGIVADEIKEILEKWK